MLSPLQKALLLQLSHRAFQSGACLAAKCRVSRTAVWKAMGALTALGMPILHERKQGYRFAFPFEPLSREAIEVALRQRGFSPRVEIFDLIDSTSTYLMDAARRGAPHGSVAMAEGQLKGRGRRGRQWISPLGENLYVSVLLRFQQAPAAVGVFSLVAGIALAEALSEQGLRGHGIKWPNDIWVSGRKLAGILPELHGEVDGPCALVLGFGVNVHMHALPQGNLDQPWTSLALEGVRLPDRNRLAVALLTHVLRAYERFCVAGFEAFRETWCRYDLLRGVEVSVSGLAQALSGRVQGLTPAGHLQLHTGNELIEVHSGEVSVRMQTQG